MDIEKLDLDIRTFNAFKRAGINTVEDYLNYPDKDRLKSIVGSKNFEKFLEAYKPASPTVQPERAAEISESFNYAVLTAELGDYLKHMEEKLRNEYMNFTANCGRIFAEAQEKLAKHGFGENNGVFEKWITAMGFKKSTVYEMIKIHNFRSSKIRTNEQAQLFDSLSKSLQYEVAKPSAPPELVEQVMNGDITTHKEYIKLKKELEEAQEKAAFWNKANTATNEENQKLRAERVNAMNRADNAERELSQVKENLEISEDDVRKAEERAEYAENKFTEISVKKYELEQRVKELENKPVDVAVDVDELNRRVSAAVSKINSETEHTLAAERREFADTLNAKDDRIWELEDEVKKLKSSPTYTRNEKILAFQMSMDQYKKLLEIVNGSNDKELYKAVQSVKFFN